ncbi:undecaprenyl-phosphate alpha-N-acetylglucosaminyl 1-phosphate transferase [Paenibacillus sp. J31TS4]|uniref:MraY family glycosyltransferase n=1 Tax=Paenibacillus sp. J31TS4 TaxID=2807195 RepID=UPI001B041997|nr:MraY family glycosyltransferase [Paenibacillus sp. J31TS4]GIP40092.1 undecaprenyl-phosphate alpha-N-acetylglucosaminyl 1-phosphate transferase [Paenibacillus sp. J31TS4]
MRYAAAFAVALLIVYLLIPLLRRTALRIGFVDKPSPDKERKLHKEPVPLAAGIAIFAGVAVSYALFVSGYGRETWGTLTGALLILGIGTVDDWFKTQGREFPALPKMLIQVLAAVVVYASGIVFVGFVNPFTHEMVILPTVVQFLLTVLWIFGVTTVINFSDGMDGLAGGLSAISAMTLFVVALAKGQSDSALVAIMLVGAAIGYLKYNKPPAKIYMGDAGATFLGFMLAVIALDGAFKQATVLSLFIPILALGVPIFDNLFVVVRRLLAGKPIYQADATQVHYRLLSAGLNPKQVLAVLCLVSVCFSLSSIILLLLPV